MISEIKDIKRPTMKDVIKIRNNYYYAKHVVPVIKSLKKHDVRIVKTVDSLAISYSRGESGGYIEFKPVETKCGDSLMHIGSFQEVWHTKEQQWKREKSWIKIRNTYPIGELK